MGEDEPESAAGRDGEDARGGPGVGAEDAPTDSDADVPGALGVEVDPDAGGPAAFMQALRVPRNARVGALVGIAFALLVYVFFVVVPGTYRSPLWYLGLGFVLAVSTAGLVATLLTLARAVRLSRDL